MLTGDKAAAARSFDIDTPFELKSAAFTLMHLVIYEADADKLVRQLQAKLRPGFFDGDAVVIDLRALQGKRFDFSAVVQVLRSVRASPVAVIGVAGEQVEAAALAGLAVLPEHAASASRAPASSSEPALVTDVVAEADVAPVIEATASPAQAELALGEPAVAPRRATRIIDKPVRTGQQIYAKDADLVVLDSVAAGAELLADGSIHVYGPLRGRAHAGVGGDTAMRIFAQVMDPQMVSIAGIYRTLDEPLPPSIHKHAAQVLLEGNKLLFVPLANPS